MPTVSSGYLAGLAILAVFVYFPTSEAKLKWKCELFDTSRENSTIRTKFTDFVEEKVPKLNEPRVVRSTKCRPRPKNGTIAISRKMMKEETTTEKPIERTTTSILDSSEEDNVQKKIYQRKAKKPANDLIKGPGYEKSNELRDKNGKLIPRIFRPSELKPLADIAKPIIEELNENVMPDIEFEDDKEKVDEEDLPWCPEEEETPKRKIDCENVNIENLSSEELSQYRAECVIPPTKPTTAGPKGIDGTPEPIKFDCFKADKSNMTKEELKEHNKHCKEHNNDIPETNSTSICLQTVVRTMTKEEQEKYDKYCDEESEYYCDSLTEEKVQKMSKKEKKEYRKYCNPAEPYDNEINKSPSGNKTCLDQMEDFWSMTREEYKSYMKKCEKYVKVVDKIENSYDCKKDKKSLKKLTEEELKEYKKNCKCDGNEDMTDEQFEIMLKECYLEEIEEEPPLSPARRKHGECAKLKKRSKTMNEKEYVEYLEKCKMNPTKVVRVVKEECDDIDTENMTSKQFESYKKDCLVEESCLRVSSAVLTDREEALYEALCVEREDEIDCSEKSLKEADSETWRKYERNCVFDLIPKQTVTVIKKKNCETIDISKLNTTQLKAYKAKCVIKNQRYEGDNCEDVEIEKLSEEECIEYKLVCVRPPKSPKTFKEKEYNCENADIANMTDIEFKVYKKKCLSKTIVPTRRHRKTCKYVKIEVLSKKEFKEYKRKCIRKPNTPPTYRGKACRNIDSRRLHKDEYIEYQKKCPSEPVVPPKYNGSVCDDVDIENLSDQEFETYKEKCLESLILNDCEDVNIDELDDEETEEYKKRCLIEENVDTDCKDVDVAKLSKQEKMEYDEKCLSKPKVPSYVRKGCKNTDVNKLDKKEYKVYKEKCLRKKNVTVVFEGSNCDESDVENLTDKQFEEYRKTCLFEQKTKEDCDDVDITKLNKKQYELYLERCSEEIKEVKTDCADIDVWELSKKQFKEYKKKCLTLEKPQGCEDINTEKLSKQELEEYEKKCSIVHVPPATYKSRDCEKIDIDDMTEIKFKKYREKCLLERRPDEDCEHVDTTKLNKKEYEEYLKRCPEKLEKPKKECKDVNVERLNKKQFKEYKLKCLTPRKPKEGCDNVDVEKLSKQELEEYNKNCTEVHVPPPPYLTKDCEDVDVDDMADEEFEKYRRRCLVERPLGDCEDVNVEQLNKKQFKEYKRKCLASRKPEKKCEDINVEELSEQKLEEYNKNCTEVHVPPPPYLTKGCQDLDTDEMSEEEFEAYRDNCFVTSTKTTTPATSVNSPVDGRKTPYSCKNASTDGMSNEEYNEYKRRCNTVTNIERTVRVIPGGEKSDDFDCTRDIHGMTIEEFMQYKKECTTTTPVPKHPERRTIDCSDVDVRKMSSSEIDDYNRHCKVKVNTDKYLPDENLILTKKVSIITPPDSKKLSCYDRDVDDMTDEEYLEYKKQCLTIVYHKEQQYNCSKLEKKLESSNLTKEEERYHDDHCGRTSGGKVIMTKKLVVHKPNIHESYNCFDRDVDAMTDDEYIEYEEVCLNKKRTKTRTTTPSTLTERGTGTTEKPRKRVRIGLKCDTNPDDLSEEMYAVYVRDCVEVNPKNITLFKEVVVEKPSVKPGIPKHVGEPEEDIVPEDSEEVETSEQFGMRVKPHSKKLKPRRRTPEDEADTEEDGSVSVTRRRYRVPARKRSEKNEEEENEESGAVKVEKMTLRTTSNEGENVGEDYEKIETIPGRRHEKEEVSLISVKKNRGRKIHRKNTVNIDVPGEIVKIVRRNEPSTIRRVAIYVRPKQVHHRRYENETEIEDSGFKVHKKTVRRPLRIKKVKSTTTTTTISPEPEYYYDEEEVPIEITIVSVRPSRRRIWKQEHSAEDFEEENDEIVERNEPNKTKIYDGYVRVKDNRRKLTEKTESENSDGESEEEPEIREVIWKRESTGESSEKERLRRIVLKSTKRKLRQKTVAEEEGTEDENENEERRIRISKRKKLRIGREEQDVTDEEQDGKEIGRVKVRNQKRKVGGDSEPEEDDEEDQEEMIHSTGKVTVKRNRLKVARRKEEDEDRVSNGTITTRRVVRKRTKQFYRVKPNGEKELVEIIKVNGKRKIVPVADGGLEGAKNQNETKFGKTETELDEFKPDGENGKNRTNDDGYVKITKSVIIDEGIPTKPEGSGDLAEEEEEGSGEDQEIVQTRKYRIGPDGIRHLIKVEKNGKVVMEANDRTRERFNRKSADDVDGSGEESSSDADSEEGETVVHKRKIVKKYYIGPDGKKKLVDVRTISKENNGTKEDGENTNWKTPGENDDEGFGSGEEEEHSSSSSESKQITRSKRISKRYRIGPDGKRILISKQITKTGGKQEDNDDNNESGERDGNDMKVHTNANRKDSEKKEQHESQESNDEEENDGVLKYKKNNLSKIRRKYKINKNGERELVEVVKNGKSFKGKNLEDYLLPQNPSNRHADGELMKNESSHESEHRRVKRVLGEKTTKPSEFDTSSSDENDQSAANDEDRDVETISKTKKKMFGENGHGIKKSLPKSVTKGKDLRYHPWIDDAAPEMTTTENEKKVPIAKNIQLS